MTPARLSFPAAPAPARGLGFPARSRATPELRTYLALRTKDIEMTIFATDHADSGEVVRLHPDIVDTWVPELAKPTRNLTGYARNLPPTNLIRRHTDEHAALPTPATIGVIADPIVAGERPMGPVPPPPPPPPTPSRAPSCRCGCRSTGKRLFGRGTRRRPRPMWAWLLTRVGLDLMVGAAITLAVIR